MTEHDKQDSIRTAILALLGVQLLFGVHYSIAKEITAVFPPLAWTFYRVGGATLILLMLLPILRKPFPKGARNWLMLVVLGVFGIGLNQLLFNEGISRSHAIHSVLVMATIPTQALVFGVLLRQEHFTFPKVLSVLAGLVGVFILMELETLFQGGATWLVDRDGKEVESFWDTILAGNLMMLTNAASFSFFLALSRRYRERFDATTFTFGAYVGGMVLVLPWCLGSSLTMDYGAITPEIWWLGVFVVLGPTVGTYFLNFYAIKRVSTSLVGLFVYVQFVIAAITAGLWHGEALDERTIGASALVLGGLGVRFLWPKKKPQNAAATNSQDDQPSPA